MEALALIATIFCIYFFMKNRTLRKEIKLANELNKNLFLKLDTYKDLYKSSIKNRKS